MTVRVVDWPGVRRRHCRACPTILESFFFRCQRTGFCQGRTLSVQISFFPLNLVELFLKYGDADGVSRSVSFICMQINFGSRKMHSTRDNRFGIYGIDIGSMLDGNSFAMIHGKFMQRKMTRGTCRFRMRGKIREPSKNIEI